MRERAARALQSLDLPGHRRLRTLLALGLALLAGLALSRVDRTRYRGPVYRGYYEYKITGDRPLSSVFTPCGSDAEWTVALPMADGLDGPYLGTFYVEWRGTFMASGFPSAAPQLRVTEIIRMHGTNDASSLVVADCASHAQDRSPIYRGHYEYSTGGDMHPISTFKPCGADHVWQVWPMVGGLGGPFQHSGDFYVEWRGAIERPDFGDTQLHVTATLHARPASANPAADCG